MLLPLAAEALTAHIVLISELFHVIPFDLSSGFDPSLLYSSFVLLPPSPLDNLMYYLQYPTNPSQPDYSLSLGPRVLRLLSMHPACLHLTSLCLVSNTSRLKHTNDLSPPLAPLWKTTAILQLHSRLSVVILLSGMLAPLLALAKMTRTKARKV
ncbi:hypothetical protein BDP27DRAFT_1429178 [Rhodocollybia butyracea]|uniref:Uncharacterized protein n=1 Tax=Rhodocollybia butyracea TaxID=206335 RepID=A0A9P5PDL5_9AGAR|nr:hypothetical protein BDP27DRAFT_1429178 [Rhodocollybia butyracea]